VQLAGVGKPGIYHLVNEGAVSRWAFARYILDHAGYADTPITKIDSSAWQRASSPPPHTALANTAAHHLGVTLRPWEDAVDAFLAREGLRDDG
jgi:dTDP-4-dehydrorhamnose reductase